MTESTLATRLGRHVFGLPFPVSRPADIAVPPGQVAWARTVRARLGPTSRPLIAINRRNILFKRWPAESYRHLIASAISELGATVVAVGLADEGLAYDGAHFFDLTGDTEFEQLVAMLSICDGFVGVDSGCGHLAAGLGLPTVLVTCPAAFRRQHWRVLPVGISLSVVYPDIRCSAACEECLEPCLPLVPPEAVSPELRWRLSTGGASRLVGASPQERGADS